MITYKFDHSDFATFREGIKREWALTNGIGGYAGSSLIGAHNRTHQGYLIASLHAPTERYLVFSKVSEMIRTGSMQYDLETSQYLTEGKTQYKNGQDFLTAFSYDGSVHYTYCCGSLILTKHICLEPGKNVCAVSYEICNNGDEAELTLVPLFNFREHSASSTRETLDFTLALSQDSLCLTPKTRPEYTIVFQCSEGDFRKHTPVYAENMQLQTEVDLETDGLDSHYCPYELALTIPAAGKKRVTLLCSLQPAEAGISAITEDTGFALLKKRLA